MNTGQKARKNTIELLNLLDEGVLDEKKLVKDLLNYLSEAEVTEFMESYGYKDSLEEGENKMFYEEKVIDGILHWRGTPKGD
jgi:hypothetical protein